jgi:hypothetical protein
VLTDFYFEYKYLTSHYLPNITYNFPKNLIQQSLLEKLTVYSASQKISRLLWKQKVHYHVPKVLYQSLSEPHECNLNPKPYIPKIRFIILQYTKIFRTVSSPRLPKRNFKPIFHLPNACYKPAHLILPLLDHPNYTWRTI